MHPKKRQQQFLAHLIFYQCWGGWLMATFLHWYRPLLVFSFALGGFCYMLAQTLCLKVYFRHWHAAKAKTMLRSLWLGKVLQLSLLGLFTYFCLRYCAVNMLPYLLSWLWLHGCLMFAIK